ncbi:hypothetical protein G9A89_000903 [Geosiphon pyriformis]|nr:hypothetical protein G9A89_000903 [Geosiphon pyriformis]
MISFKKTKSSEKWEQLLAFAIVTPNPFVVLNKILDKISIASSGIYQKFAEWVASILVLDATFKIQLAYIKAVFQLVHGFLGVKSSGSSSVAVVLRDVPLGVSAANIKTALSVFVMFGSQADLNLAVAKTGHLAVDYEVALSPFSKTSKVFKSCSVGSLSYAKASAPPVMSEFSPLVVFTPSVAIVNPVVGSRLDSLEKQISNLAALVKSIVEPVGSLVVLVFRFLNDNAVKAVQVEKNFFSMKYASNNFANLLVGVSKNIACFRSEVDFGGMDYDNMQTTKLSLLSKDTVECVIALWQMSGAEIKSCVKSTRLFLSEFIFDSRNLNGVIEKICELGLFSPPIVSA